MIVHVLDDDCLMYLFAPDFITWKLGVTQGGVKWCNIDPRGSTYESAMGCLCQSDELRPTTEKIANRISRVLLFYFYL